MQMPTLRDVYEAKRTIAPYLPRTPLHYSAGLSEVLQAQVYLKHDEYLPLGAFKARGGINLLAHLSILNPSVCRINPDRLRLRAV